MTHLLCDDDRETQSAIARAAAKVIEEAPAADPKVTVSGSKP